MKLPEDGVWRRKHAIQDEWGVLRMDWACLRGHLKAICKLVCGGAVPEHPYTEVMRQGVICDQMLLRTDVMTTTLTFTGGVGTCNISGRGGGSDD